MSKCQLRYAGNDVDKETDLLSRPRDLRPGFVQRLGCGAYSMVVLLRGDDTWGVALGLGGPRGIAGRRFCLAENRSGGCT